MTLEQEIEDLLENDYPIGIMDYLIVSHNGTFRIYTDIDSPSYYHPVGGWDDETHQQYATFIDIFKAVKQLLLLDEEK